MEMTLRQNLCFQALSHCCSDYDFIKKNCNNLPASWKTVRDNETAVQPQVKVKICFALDRQDNPVQDYGDHPAVQQFLDRSHDWMNKDSVAGLFRITPQTRIHVDEAKHVLILTQCRVARFFLRKESKILYTPALYKDDSDRFPVFLHCIESTVNLNRTALIKDLSTGAIFAKVNWTEDMAGSVPWNVFSALLHARRNALVHSTQD